MFDSGNGSLGIAFGGQLAGTVDIEGTVDQGCPAPPHELTADAAGDAFVAALDPNGCVFWSRLHGHSQFMEVSSLANRGGELWLAGSLEGATAIDTFPIGTSGQDVFWVQLDATAMATTLGANSVSASLDSGLVASIATRAVAAARTDNQQQVTLQPIDGVGSWMWTLTSTMSRPRALIMEPVSSDVLIVGEMGASASSSGCTLSGADSDDGFVARLANSDGACVWAQVFGGNGVQKVTAVAALDDVLVVAGSFTTSLTLPGGATLSATDGQDAFVVGLDMANGSVVWHVDSQAAGDEQVAALALTSSGRIAVVGEFTSGMGFATGVTSDDASSDGYLLVLDDVGTALWHSTLHGNGEDRIVGVAAGGDRIVVLGSQEKNATLEGYTLPFLQGAERNIVVASYEE
jgi:hypothetical protein